MTLPRADDRLDLAQLRTMASVMCLTTGSVLPALLTGALAVQMGRSLGFGPIAQGLAVSGFFVGGGIAGATLGRAIDRIGWVRAGRLSSVVTCIALAGIATGAQTYPTLLVLLLLGGTANGLAVPAANLAIASEIPVRRWAVAFGIKQSSGPAALILAGASIPLIALRWGWRWVFVVAIAVPLFAGMLLPPEGHVARPSLPASSIPRPRPTRRLSVIAVAGGLAAGSALAVGTFFTAAAVQAGASEAGAGRLLTIGSVGAIVLRLAYGWLADRFGSSGYLPTATLLAIGGVGFALAANGNISLLTTLLVFGAGWGWQGLMHFSVVNAHQDMPAAATGVLLAGMHTGASAGPFVFGVAAGVWSLAQVWWGTAAVIVFAAMLLVTAGHQWPSTSAATS